MIQVKLEQGTAGDGDGAPVSLGDALLTPCSWSARTALDSRHRPQSADRPSSTVRREWARFPQEAHLLDLPGGRIRRLTADEIARIQGFDAPWFHVPGLQPADAIRAAGDAVPPPLARALYLAIDKVVRPGRRTALEICAGAGGLASGASAVGYESVALVERWSEACRILRHGKEWARSAVQETDVRTYSYRAHRDGVGVLSGGPPCQPWSRAGARAGQDDPRDLLGMVDQVVAAVRPQAVLLENVPGLLAAWLEPYQRSLIRRLRNPAPGLSYGVLLAKLNAADFGVPQCRERVFILGIKGGLARDCEVVFQQVLRQATHADVPWRTVGDVVSRDDGGGWMAWHYGPPGKRRRG